MHRKVVATLIAGAFVMAAPGCIAVLDWDFEAGAGGSGGMGGTPDTSTSSSIAGTSTSSTSSGQGGGGMGGAGGGNVCSGCTYGRRYGDAKAQTPISMALAPDGSLYFTGYYDGELRLDANHALQDTVGTGTQPFLAKLDREGNPVWITNPRDFIATGGGGNSVSIANGLVAWTGSVPNGAQGSDTFVEIRTLQADAQSTVIRKAFGTSIDDGLRSSALSPDGKTLYIAGGVTGMSSSVANCPNSQSFNTNGQQNLMVYAIDTTTGNCLWGKTWTGGNHLAGSISVATGSDGSPFVTGHFTMGTISNNQGFSFPAVPSAADPKYGAVGFILKLNKLTGDMIAARGYAHAAFLVTTADHSTGTIVAVGGAGTEITFKGMTYPAATGVTDGADNLALAFDENLNEKWISITGGPDRQACFGAASDGAGRVYLTCLTADRLDRGANINCEANNLCSVLIGLSSANGVVNPSQNKTFGDTQMDLGGGKTFVVTANSTALAVGGTWSVPVSFWDGAFLNAAGVPENYDIGIGKVEPKP